MLTRKQHELICFIEDRLAQTGISPSFEEMKDALSLKSKSGVHRLISALEERGFIRRLPNRARALEIMRQPGRGEAPVLDAPSHDAAVRDAPLRDAPLRDAPLRDAPLRDAETAQAATAQAADNVIAMPARGDRRGTAANDVVQLPLHGRIAAGLPIEAFEDSAQLAVPAALLGPGDHYALEVSGDSMIEAGILNGDYALIQRTDVARDGDIVVALVDGTDATLKYFRQDGRIVQLDPANATHEPQRYAANRVLVQGKLAGLLRRYH